MFHFLQFLHAACVSRLCPSFRFTCKKIDRKKERCAHEQFVREELNDRRFRYATSRDNTKSKIVTIVYNTTTE